MWSGGYYLYYLRRVCREDSLVRDLRNFSVLGEGGEDLAKEVEGAVRGIGGRVRGRDMVLRGEVVFSGGIFISDV